MKNRVKRNFLRVVTSKKYYNFDNGVLYLGGEDSGTELMPWGPLFVVDVPPDKQAPEAGLNSTEKDVQLARQRTVLEAIFFNKAM